MKHELEQNVGIWRREKVPMRMTRLSGLGAHFMRRRSSVMRSTEATSSKLGEAMAAAAAGVWSNVVWQKERERERVQKHKTRITNEVLRVQVTNEQNNETILCLPLRILQRYSLKLLYLFPCPLLCQRSSFTNYNITKVKNLFQDRALLFV